MKDDDLGPTRDPVAQASSTRCRPAMAMPWLAACVLLGCNLDHCPEDYRLVRDRCVLELDGGELSDGSVADAEADGEVSFDPCPEDYRRVGDRCILQLDGGADGDSCGDSCPEASPRCHEASRTCVECLEDADCGPREPACRENACVSCAGRNDCGDELVLREAQARLCACLVQQEPRDRELLWASDELRSVTETLQAHQCHARSIEDVPTDLFGLREQIEEGRAQIDLEAVDCAVVDSMPFVVPAVAPGGACTSDAQCIGGRCGDCTCTSTHGIECRTSYVCGTLACLPDTQTCGEAPIVGAACVDRCAEELVCRAGLCRGPGSAADECSTYRSGQCEQGLFCEPQTEQCRPGLTAGQECDRFSRQCAVGLYCGRDETCEALVAQGDACTARDRCAPGLRCVSGACRPIRLFDEPCDDQAPCAHGLGCIDGSCQSLPLVGEPCGEAGCLRGTCTEGRCRDLPPGADCVHWSDPPNFWSEALDECGVSATCVAEDSEATPRCRRVAAEGESCQSAVCDVGLDCEDGECVALDSCG